MMTKNTGKPYELLTQSIFNSIINSDPTLAKTIDVQHDVTLQGNNNTHQIDVYWEFEVGGIKYRTLIQAKDKKRKVEQSQMETFQSVLADLPGSTGIFVTRTGFQEGALRLANAIGVKTYVLREPKDNDWDGYIKVVNIQLHFTSLIVRNLQLIVDGNWAVQNGIMENFHKKWKPSLMTVMDSANAETTFDKILLGICEKNKEEPIEYEHKFDDNTYLRYPDGSKIKVLGIKGIFGTRELVSGMEIDAGDLIGHILKDVTSGEVMMFGKGEIGV
jgi:hypothetical protein